MSIVYVGLDLGSSNFQQVALNHDGVTSPPKLINSGGKETSLLDSDFHTRFVRRL